MERLDLEVFEASLDAGVLLNLTHWRVLIAELGAAREVVEAARPYEDYIPPQDVPPGKHPLADALANYDRAARAT